MSNPPIEAVAPALNPRRRRWSEWLFWGVSLLVSTIGNALTALMDARRNGHDLHLWEPMTWELTSNGIVLVTLPLLLWACERWPLHADTWRRRLPLYLASSLAWSIVHVSSMFWLREWVYWLRGFHYHDDASLLTRYTYEYLKDARTFFLIVTLAHFVDWFDRRRKGEALLLAAPDEGPAVESIERPERFLIRKLGRDFLVATADVEWVQASGNYVNLRVRGHDYPLRSTLAGLEARLDPQRFVRVHRSYLVNLSQVASIEPLDSGDARVHLHDGTAVPCSRSYRAALRELA
ncbi:LytTR family DNA-binding domain-containing protein [Pseudoxanthomonas sp.]|uniref:LytTR family DNA-binding domain-containing protein n=1 Tax=Pseudoxanthomonas sp. TaxID=1871049 RepID=UPI00260BB847|nr:LytTR family DNA-binding domain-containing protein [Pseudoxanthomonas sp.]WDS36794.1 MAG: LytTR family DNA-binding domain-containing protein [Pseudoxanthomonas sp.]